MQNIADCGSTWMQFMKVVFFSCRSKRFSQCLNRMNRKKTNYAAIFWCHLQGNVFTEGGA